MRGRQDATSAAIRILWSHSASQDELGEKLDVQNAMLEELTKRRKRFLLF